MQDRDAAERLQQMILPHLDAAYNLARYLAGNEADAQDIVQEACLRATKFADTSRGENPRGWLLTIVRRTCYTWLETHRADSGTLSLDELEDAIPVAHDSLPDAIFIRNVNRETLRAAIDALPLPFREVIILRELENLSYTQIAQVAGISLGTVMSRLARARTKLKEWLVQHIGQENLDDLR